ncbi:MAG: cystathionine beta-synthase, partial [Acidobacteria bacterium]|nr:cystathionine beta-synthase [Acidobacteriota bacterium]
MRKKIADNVLEIIGRTPMVRLNRITKDVKGTVVATLETFNPGN